MNYTGILTIPIDVLARILGLVPHKDVNEFRYFRGLVESVEETSAYWKYSVETLLGTYLKDRPGSNWKRIYKKLVQHKLSFIELVKNYEVDSVAVLLETEIEPPLNAVIYAAENGFVEIMKLFIADKRVDLSARDNVLIVRAVEYNRPGVVKLLLEDGRADPTARRNLAIKKASLFGYAEVVKLLLEDGRVDPVLF